MRPRIYTELFLRHGSCYIFLQNSHVCLRLSFSAHPVTSKATDTITFYTDTIIFDPFSIYLTGGTRTNQLLHVLFVCFYFPLLLIQFLFSSIIILPTMNILPLWTFFVDSFETNKTTPLPTIQGKHSNLGMFFNSRVTDPDPFNPFFGVMGQSLHSATTLLNFQSLVKSLCECRGFKLFNNVQCEEINESRFQIKKKEDEKNLFFVHNKNTEIKLTKSKQKMRR